MTTYYIDPTYGPGGDGSNETPWDSWADAVAGVANWTGHTFLMKCDTEENYPLPIPIILRANVTIGNYGAGSKPLLHGYTTTSTGDWSEISANVWRYVAPVGGVPAFVRFGDINRYGTYSHLGGEAGDPDADMEYTHTARNLDVFSIGNPVTYYGAVYVGWGSVFNAQSCDNLLVEAIDFADVWAGCTHNITFDGTYTLKIRNCNVRNCYRGFISVAYAVDRFHLGEIDGCKCYDATAAAIYSGGGYNGFRIQNCLIDGAGLNDSEGGHYGANHTGETANGLIIQNNEVMRVQYGNYWLGDGGGIEIDSQGQNTLIRNNYIHDCVEALHDNSGTDASPMKGTIPGTNTWEGNRIEDCDRMIAITGGQEVSHTTVRYNTAMRISSDRSAIICARTTGTISITDNRLETRAGTEAGIRAGSLAASNQITEARNIISGFVYPRGYGGFGATTEVALAATSSIVSCGDDNIPALDSDAIASGLWTAEVKPYNGNCLPLTPDIGAFQNWECPGRKSAATGIL